MNPIRVVLVDDQVLFVKSLNIVLKTKAKSIDVVGIAYDGQQALNVVETTKPDLVFMDVRMPTMDGVECTRRIKQAWPDIHVVMLTTFDDDEYVLEALNLGASGYLLKDVGPAEVTAAAAAVCRGGVLISPRIAAKLAKRALKVPGQTAPEERPPGFSALSAREVEILEMICSGYGNKEIADTLFIAEQTVKNHVSKIYAKLGVENRFRAVRLAQSSGFLSARDGTRGT
jgi:DNA-binding NarL/FixJ family response regulator